MRILDSRILKPIQIIQMPKQTSLKDRLHTYQFSYPSDRQLQTCNDSLIEISNFKLTFKSKLVILKDCTEIARSTLLQLFLEASRSLSRSVQNREHNCVYLLLSSFKWLQVQCTMLNLAARMQHQKFKLKNYSQIQSHLKFQVLLIETKLISAAFLFLIIYLNFYFLNFNAVTAGQKELTLGSRPMPRAMLARAMVRLQSEMVRHPF